VDSPTSGYATVMYQIIKDKAGLEKEKDTEGRFDPELVVRASSLPGTGRK